jgi:hypothetical protein
MMSNIFETPQAQKQLAAVGRKMQDYSEDFGKIHGLKQLKDPGLRVLNELSQVGGMLIRYGTTFGTKLKDFNEHDMQLIAMFMQGQITADYLKEQR